MFLTGYITWILVKWFDGFFQPLLPINTKIPGIGMLATFLIILFVGFIASNFLGKNIIGFGERILNKMPFVRNIYTGTKQIVETIFTQNGTHFKHVGLIEYPRKDLYAVVFIATQSTDLISDAVDKAFKQSSKKIYKKKSQILTIMFFCLQHLIQHQGIC